MAPPRRFCSDISREHGEPMEATASRVDRWILIEHHGAWGKDAIDSSGLPVEVKAHLAERATALRPSKVLFIRRRERKAADGDPCLLGRARRRAGRGCRRPSSRATRTCSASTSPTPVTRRPIRCCSSARTASTTPAARSTAYRCTRRCETSSTKGGSGSARTWAATGSRAMSSVCPKASTTDASAPATPWRWSRSISRAGFSSTSIADAPVIRFACRRRRAPSVTAAGALGLHELELRSTSPIVFRAGGTEYEVDVAVEHGDLAQLTCNAAGLSRPRRYVARILRESAV